MSANESGEGRVCPDCGKRAITIVVYRENMEQQKRTCAPCMAKKLRARSFKGWIVGYE